MTPPNSLVWLDASTAHRSVKVLAAAGLALSMIAMAHSGPSKDELREEILRLEEVVTAREGELALVRLHLARLDAVTHESRRHRIPADLAAAIHDIAEVEGIDPALAFSLVRVESSFTRQAVSSAGAVGLTQLMPSTAFWLDPSIRYRDLFEHRTNLRIGFRYLRMLIDAYDGNLDLALHAYNRGPGRVDSILRAGGNPSNGYARAVLAGR